MEQNRALLALMQRQLVAMQGIVETLVILVDTLTEAAGAEDRLPASNMQEPPGDDRPAVFGRKRNDPGEASGDTLGVLPPSGPDGVIGDGA